MAAAVRYAAAKARGHGAPATAVGSAQAAAIVPAVERQRDAATASVTALDQAKADQVRRDAFKKSLKDAIEKATPQPKTESEADRVRTEGAQKASGALRGELASQKEGAAGPLRSAAKAETPVAGGGAASQLVPEPAGPPVAKLSAAGAVPEPLPAERLDYSSDRAPTDQAMSEAGVTESQLRKGNEPSFGSVMDSRATAEKHEAKAEGAYRRQEAGVQGHALGTARAELGEGAAAIHDERLGQVGKVVTKQTNTRDRDAAERQRITDQVTGIKTAAQRDVDRILTEMDTEAAKVFDDGLHEAERVYEQTFEDEKGGVGTWLTTWGDDWEELIERSLGKARQAYLKRVDVAIDAVATCVDTKLKAAKQRVAAGVNEVKTFVEGLSESSRKLGQDAIDGVTADFEAMEAGIDERRDALIDNLAQQYKASYDRMSAMEEKLREENKSLWQRVYDATVGLIKKILAFKDMLLGILAKAASVIGDIISDPIGFLGNLVSGVMLGLKNFVANLGVHLRKGLLDWLFGAIGASGLQLPDTLDLKGIISIVLQVLGLTYANFRARAVTIVGEPVVAALEQAADVFKVLVTEGVSGVVRLLTDKLAELKETVLDGIFTYIKEKVLEAGITWIIGLLNPASAFFKACKAVYDIVMFFITRGSQIMELVNAVLDSMAAIAKGSISVAANFVEKALAKAIPVAISFLASLLGLGDIGAKIRKILDKAQAPVNKAIDWLIHQAVKLVKKVGSAIKGLVGNKDGAGMDQHDPDGPEHFAKVQAGLVTLHQAELKRGGDGLSKEEAQASANEAKSKHPIFKNIEIEAGPEGWIYKYSASKVTPENSKIKGGDPLCVVKIVRSTFTAETKEELFDLFPDRSKMTAKGSHGVAKGQHRRHIVSSDDMAKHYETVINVLALSKAAALLRAKGEGPPVGTKVTNEVIQTILQERHGRFFNDLRNLFLGDAGPNVVLQNRADWEHLTETERRAHVRYIKRRFALDSTFKPNE